MLRVFSAASSLCVFSSSPSPLLYTAAFTYRSSWIFRLLHTVYSFVIIDHRFAAPPLLDCLSYSEQGRRNRVTGSDHWVFIRQATERIEREMKQIEIQRMRVSSQKTSWKQQ
ncbi:hypothetical protein L1887_31437 [Cichorium endivia]|nr:hypothetical protein L1887_31437 [Cichorium endivia]